MRFTIKLADTVIEIESNFPNANGFYREYLTEGGTPAFTVRPRPEDVAAEAAGGERDGGEGDGGEWAEAAPEHLETLAVLRLIADKMPLYGRFLVHGAAITFRGKAYLFTAPSGTGKTTHIYLWRKFLGDAVGIVNGDKPFLAVDSAVDGTEDAEGADREDLIRVCGSPWAGKESWQRNCAAPLNGICFIRQAEGNTIRRLAPENCLDLLMRQVYLPADPIAAGKVLELTDRLLQKIPVFLLECNISEEAVRCSFEALTGEAYPVGLA